MLCVVGADGSGVGNVLALLCAPLVNGCCITGIVALLFALDGGGGGGCGGNGALSIPVGIIGLDDDEEDECDVLAILQPSPFFVLLLLFIRTIAFFMVGVKPT